MASRDSLRQIIQVLHDVALPSLHAATADHPDPQATATLAKCMQSVSQCIAALTQLQAKEAQTDPRGAVMNQLQSSQPGAY